MKRLLITVLIVSILLIVPLSVSAATMTVEGQNYLSTPLTDPNLGVALPPGGTVVWSIKMTPEEAQRYTSQMGIYWRQRTKEGGNFDKSNLKYRLDVDEVPGAWKLFGGWASIWYPENRQSYTGYKFYPSYNGEYTYFVYTITNLSQDQTPYLRFLLFHNGTMCEYKASNVDLTIPETTINLNGSLGLDQWYRSNVTVSLCGTDSDSGVAKTEYSFDNLNWNTYKEPFTIDTEGITNLYYRSIDNAANVEPVKQSSFKIDKTPPTANAEAVQQVNLLEVKYDAKDQVSGLAQVEATLNGEPVNYGDIVPANKLGLNELKVVATDFAGNSTTAVKTFEVYLPVEVTIVPKQINLQADGEITAFVSLPPFYYIAPLPNTVRLNGIPAVGYNMITSKHLIFKFRRSELGDVLEKGTNVPVTLTGYSGSYYIRGTTLVSVK